MFFESGTGRATEDADADDKRNFFHRPFARRKTRRASGPGLRVTRR